MFTILLSTQVTSRFLWVVKIDINKDLKIIHHKTQTKCFNRSASKWVLPASLILITIVILLIAYSNFIFSVIILGFGVTIINKRFLKIRNAQPVLILCKEHIELNKRKFLVHSISIIERSAFANRDLEIGIGKSATIQYDCYSSNVAQNT